MIKRTDANESFYFFLAEKHA